MKNYPDNLESVIQRKDYFSSIIFEGHLRFLKTTSFIIHLNKKIYEKFDLDFFCGSVLHFMQ